jgi:copper chaperone NosL
MSMRDKRHLLALCLFIGVTFLANCEKQAVEPIALVPEDMCAYCKMAISEKRYAAEFIDSEGQPSKFDDIGCMGNFIRNRNATAITAYFVMDFNERKWINADHAYYVRSAELTTPMNGGIIAFQNESDAREAIGKYHGTPLRFKDILNQ